MGAKKDDDLKDDDMSEEKEEVEAGSLNRTIDCLHRQKKIRIMIPSTETNKDDVTIGINGYVYQIQRDKEVEVPADVIAVLDNAKYITYKQKKREDGEGNELIPQETLRFPYQRN